VIEMPKTYIISKEQAEEIALMRKKVRDKRVDKRLQAIQLRGEGMKTPGIAAKLDTAPNTVSQWVSDFCNHGVESLMGGKYGGNRRNMSIDEEVEFLAQFKERAANGQIVEVSEIERAYVEKVGHRIGGSQIYRVLERHGWRKLMPRSKHPNKASDEAIEASKKLTAKLKK